MGRRPKLTPLYRLNPKEAGMVSEHPLWAHLRDQHNHITDGLTDADVEHWQKRHDEKLHAPTTYLAIPHNHKENEVDTRFNLPLGCVFDSHMGWHNTYRLVNLAVANGLVLSEGDRLIMEAFEKQDTSLSLDSDSYGEADIAEFALEISEKALEFLSNNCCAPFQYVEWDDGDLMVKTASAEDIYGQQGWNDSTFLNLAIQFIDADYTGERRAAFDTYCRDVAIAENTGCDACGAQAGEPCNPFCTASPGAQT